LRHFHTRARTFSFKPRLFLGYDATIHYQTPTF
jgi:hypothetical protein